MTNKTKILKDIANKRLNVTREFNAPLDKVWQAWTESELLDKWWAPKPWKAETKSMDFKAGGLWLYSMVSPEGERHWSRVNYKTVNTSDSFTYVCVFCDENGNASDTALTMNWLIEFATTETGTKVEATITFDKEADMAKIIEMGFEGGFTMGLNNLAELLEA